MNTVALADRNRLDMLTDSVEQFSMFCVDVHEVILRTWYYQWVSEDHVKDILERGSRISLLACRAENVSDTWGRSKTKTESEKIRPFPNVL